MKYLMTGSYGDVGSALFSLICSSGTSVEHYQPETISSATRLLHLAAKSPPFSVDEMIKSNIVFLQNVIAYCKKNNINELVFFSGAAIYGSQNCENVTEETPYVASGFYGVSKLLGEEILRESNLKVLCIRLPAILSIRNSTNVLSRIYARLKANEQVLLSNANRLFNNFISIENIWAFISGFKFQSNFDVINLASKKEMTLYSITELMKKQLGSSSEIKIEHRDVPFFNLSTAKAEQQYGYVPCVSQSTIEYWLKQRNKL